MLIRNGGDQVGDDAMKASQILIGGCFKLQGRLFKMRDRDVHSSPVPDDMLLVEDVETGLLGTLWEYTEIETWPYGECLDCIGMAQHGCYCDAAKETS